MAMNTFLSRAALVAGICTMPLGGAWAMTSNSDAMPTTDGGAVSDKTAMLLAQAQAAIDAGDYEAAMAPLEEIIASEPSNADALNMLGYSSRSLERYSEAMDYYEQALAADPEHLGANEYFGELQLKLGNLAAAEERLAVLDEVCYLGCDEYDALEAAIEAFKTAE